MSDVCRCGRPALSTVDTRCAKHKAADIRATAREAVRQAADAPTLMDSLLIDSTTHGRVRTSDPRTSHSAARDNLPRAGTQRYRIFQQYSNAGPHGLTDEEAWRRAGLRAESSPWKRSSELRELGWILPTGFQRSTSTGSMADVCTITTLGRRMWEAARR